MSVEEPVESDAPIWSASSAICSAERFWVPSSSISAVKDASPGRSGGFAALPLRTTRFAETTGRLCCSTRYTVSPFDSLKVTGTGRSSCEKGPAGGL